MNLYLNKEGRLGNTLLKYFFGFVITRRTEANFFTRFKLNIPFIEEKYSDRTTFDGTLLENWNGNTYTLLLNDKEISKDLDGIATELFNSGCQHINVSGYYQNVNYYIPYVHVIRHIFKNNDHYLKLTENIDTSGTGLLIRKDDIINSPHELPDDWYIKMANKFKDTQIYFSSDTIHHPVCQTLAREYGAKFIQANSLDTILVFSQFKNLILSQGTFSWWAGFLNEDNVYSMIPDSGWNSDQCDVNLKTPWWNWLKLKEI